MRGELRKRRMLEKINVERGGRKDQEEREREREREMVEELAAMAESAAAFEKRPSSESGRDSLEGGEIEPADLSSSEHEAEDRSHARRQMTHPLEHSWTFWFDNTSAKLKQIAWGCSIRPVHTFTTVEDFWGLYNNIHHPSKLAVGADFSCFKYGIEPKWEDPVCANGGKWTISCSKGKVDNWWLYTLLAMIGEQFDNGDDICGAVVNARQKQEKISIWTKNGLNEASQLSIGKQWKEFLDYNDTVGFILHDDAKKHDRFAKSRYQV